MSTGHLLFARPCQLGIHFTHAHLAEANASPDTYRVWLLAVNVHRTFTFRSALPTGHLSFQRPDAKIDILLKIANRIKKIHKRN
jgi:hypothetical protein